jgi:DNA-directed RNA polymerase specialized sigma24 family protein
MTDTTAVLKIAAAEYRQAQTNLDTAREQLAAAVNDAVEAGLSQSEASRIIGVDRLTVRKWLIN